MAQNRSKIREDHLTRLDVRAYLELYELDETVIQLKFNNTLTSQIKRIRSLQSHLI